jgi:hypothetical protein
MKVYRPAKVCGAIRANQELRELHAISDLVPDAKMRRSGWDMGSEWITQKWLRKFFKIRQTPEDDVKV